MTASRPIQAPKGTRDFYPEQMLRRRYITDAWRRTALRHGFDEIDGPVFEHRELYEKKSGEGILNEMFSVFSGKDPGQREALQRGEQAPFGLRPEFTPTLARMYAAKARQLPSPCKWFCVSNFFRAERPQRGRLREFFQWNCDVVGGEAIEEPGSKSFTSTGRFDHEIIETQVGLLDGLGFSHESLQIRASNRRIVDKVLGETLREPGNRDEVFALLDARKKLDANQFLERAFALKFDVARFDSLLQYDKYKFSGAKAGVASAISHEGASPFADMDTRALAELFALCHQSLIYEWVDVDPTIVRGLAYYTGTVFEVIAEGERAVAGGGRYDNLIELFGGPPTPACGFGMGDVVLENLLNDHNLMPTGRDLVRALSEPMPVRPDVFIVTNGDAGAEQQLVPALAALRRGTLAEGQREPWDPNRYTIPPMHARRTYKATNKLGKLKADADAQHARLFVILESDGRCTVQDLDGIADERRDVPIAELNTIAAAMLKA